MSDANGSGTPHFGAIGHAIGGRHYASRLLRLINGHLIAINYFAWQLLQRSYSGPDDDCLPRYLHRPRFMRDGAGLMIPVHANLRQAAVFLACQQSRARLG